MSQQQQLPIKYEEKKRLIREEINKSVEDLFTRTLKAPKEDECNHLKTMFVTVVESSIFLEDGEFEDYKVKDLYSKVAKINKESPNIVEKEIKNSINRILSDSRNKNELNRIFGNTINSKMTVEQFFVTILQYVFIDEGMIADIAKLLKEMGVGAHLQAHDFVKRGVYLLSTTETLNSVFKRIALEFNSTEMNVKKNIEYAINKAYKNEDTKIIFKKYFGDTKPDVLTFISGIKRILDTSQNNEALIKEVKTKFGINENLQAYKYLPMMLSLCEKSDDEIYSNISKEFNKKSKEIERDLKYLIDKAYKKSKEIFLESFGKKPDVLTFIRYVKKMNI